MFVAPLLAVLAAASSVSAHFRILDPPFRGHVSAQMVVAPCGNFTVPSAVRAAFGPKSNLTIREGDGNTTITVNLGIGANPTSFPLKIGSLVVTKKDNYTIPVDLSGVSAADAKSPATIQIISDNGNGAPLLHECADVTLDIPVKEAPATTVPSAPKTTTVAATTTAKATAVATATTTPAGSDDYKPVYSSAMSNAASLAGSLLLAAASSLVL